MNLSRQKKSAEASRYNAQAHPDFNLDKLHCLPQPQAYSAGGDFTLDRLQSTPLDYLTVVSPRTDIRFASALAPPGRYQPEVVSASDIQGGGDENDLISALPSGFVSDMRDAGTLELKDPDGDGSTSSEVATIKKLEDKQEERETSDNVLVMNPTILIHDANISATLTGPFSFPSSAFLEKRASTVPGPSPHQINTPQRSQSSSNFPPIKNMSVSSIVQSQTPSSSKSTRKVPVPTKARIPLGTSTRDFRPVVRRLTANAVDESTSRKDKVEMKPTSRKMLCCF
jgi:hypothetical protein